VIQKPARSGPRSLTTADGCYFGRLDQFHFFVPRAVQDHHLTLEIAKKQTHRGSRKWPFLDPSSMVHRRQATASEECVR